MNEHFDHLSFSQLTQAEKCPFAYYLSKMASLPQKENAFSQAGSLAHQILYLWADGSAEASDLSYLWQQEYPKTVTEDFPAFMEGFREKLYSKCLRYFQRFNGFPGYDVLGAEERFETSIAGERFEGVIDLILRHQETGDLYLIDHKSCSLDTMKRSQNEMYRQLYLYSGYVKENYGAWPSMLVFNLFREGINYQRPYSAKDHAETLVWAENAVDRMRQMDIDEWMETRPEQFYCTELCSVREHCQCGKHKRKEESHGRRAVRSA